MRLLDRLTYAGVTTSSPTIFTPAKKQYADGELDPEPSKEAELEARVLELERRLGKVALENELLKKP